MGLRADEAEMILVKNQYHRKKFMDVSFVSNENAPIIFTVLASVGSAAGAVFEKYSRCSSEWQNDLSLCEFKVSTVASSVMGAVLGFAVPVYLCYLRDSREYR